MIDQAGIDKLSYWNKLKSYKFYYYESLSKILTILNVEDVIFFHLAAMLSDVRIICYWVNRPTNDKSSDSDAKYLLFDSCFDC